LPVFTRNHPQTERSDLPKNTQDENNNIINKSQKMKKAKHEKAKRYFVESAI